MELTEAIYPMSRGLILDLKCHSKLRTDALLTTKGEIGMAHHCELIVRNQLLAAQQLTLNLAFHSNATIQQLITKRLKTEKRHHRKIAIRQKRVEELVTDGEAY